MEKGPPRSARAGQQGALHAGADVASRMALLRQEPAILGRNPGAAR